MPARASFLMMEGAADKLEEDSRRHESATQRSSKSSRQHELRGCHKPEKVITEVAPTRRRCVLYANGESALRKALLIRQVGTAERCHSDQEGCWRNHGEWRKRRRRLRHVLRHDGDRPVLEHPRGRQASTGAPTMRSQALCADRRHARCSRLGDFRSRRNSTLVGHAGTKKDAGTRRHHRRRQQVLHVALQLPALLRRRSRPAAQAAANRPRRSC